MNTPPHVIDVVDGNTETHLRMTVSLNVIFQPYRSLLKYDYTQVTVKRLTLRHFTRIVKSLLTVVLFKKEPSVQDTLDHYRFEKAISKAGDKSIYVVQYST